MADFGWGHILGASGGSVTVYHVIRELLPTIQRWLRGEKNRVAVPVNGKADTFAEHPDQYWRNMDLALEKANRPLILIMEQQTRILDKLADFAAEERVLRDVRIRN